MKTTRVRIYKDMDMELKAKFPEVRSADLFRIMYNTSAIKLEGVLRRPKKPKL